MGNNICPICGKETRRNCEFCSTQCRAEAVKNYKNCIVCGKKFWCPPSEPVYCCGPICSKKHRQDITINRDENTKHITNQGILYANSHQGERHPCAKRYGIITPVGNVIEVLNLRHWVFHSGLFDKPDTAYNALIRVIGTYKGTVSPKRQMDHYAGYSIAYCDDGNKANSKAARSVPRFCKICGVLLPRGKRSYCSEKCARVAHNQIMADQYRKAKEAVPFEPEYDEEDEDND